MRVLLVHSDDRPFEVERFGTAWQRAGGDPEELVSITPQNHQQVLGNLTRFHGVLTTGGPDVSPHRYGQQPHPTTRPQPEREALDWQLLQQARAERLPVLAVCFGFQLVNVFFGGSLLQDLPELGYRGHRISDPKDAVAHVVRMDPSTRFLRGFPAAFGVNSRHHQGVDRLGEVLKPVAWAPDGIVEAVEIRDDDWWLVGVQWHPENLLWEPHLELFRRFRKACGQRGGA
ncbi:MAG: gamma-glutamyl-gamma-aminobutyrate hydrolase family protein [Thermoanaerobaculum sp.]|nr:gamma-glutamyl-gamma-aminobutyrate hydrolase family protein [Thermoanaerobaculum sp.]